MFTNTFITIILCALLVAGVSAQTTTTDLNVQGARLKLTIQGQGQLTPGELKNWVSENAETVAQYFGSFPVTELSLRVKFVSGDGLYGRAYGYPRTAIILQVGEEASLERVKKHWILCHEMSHLGFPNVENHRWLEEGMATYLEPIMRVRAGLLTENKFWKDMIHGMPHGTAKIGDRGLLYDRSWGRTYWGGALFWFLVDLDIRSRTNNDKSIDDVFRAILDDGGNITSIWSLDQIAEKAEIVTGTTSFRDHLQRFAYNAEQSDLDVIWRKLGIDGSFGQLRFENALWSELRESLVSPKGSARAPLKT